MPGTRHTGGGSTGRAARRLAAVLLAPVLVACGGGGGDSVSAQRSENGQSGNGQGGNGQGGNGSGGQTEDRRTQDTGNQGGFRTAGEPSANVQGTDSTARIQLTFPSKSTFEATVSKVADCGSSRYAVPASQPVPVTDGTGKQVTFTLPDWAPGTKSRTICLTVTVDGSSKRIQAAGTVAIITPDTGTASGQGATTHQGTTSGGSPYNGTSTGAGSNP